MNLENLNILIIDDSIDDRRLYKRFLKKNNIYEAESADEGMEIYQTQNIDCVLLDYSLPGKSGLDTLTELKGLDLHSPVVMLTGQGSEMIAVEAMKKGAQDYLVKDNISRETLHRAISGIVKNTVLQKKLAKRTHELELSNNRLEKALDDLRQAQKKIVFRERMSALGEMASGIAHDFNNALTPIIGFTELLLVINPDLRKDEKKVKKYIQFIHQAAQNATNVVRRMRGFYKPSQGQHQQIDLPELLNDIKLLTEPRWKDQAQVKGKTIEFICEIKGHPKLIANESELSELLINLVFNAIDAISQDGKISIKIYPKGDKVFFEVSDTGGGMPENVKMRCFEPFFSTKEGRGSGLGLSMVYGIVQRHGGIIDIKTEVGNGTTFIFCFFKGAKKLPKIEKQPPIQPISPLRILIVDDEIMNLVSLSEQLNGDGHTTETASDGEKALQIFASNTYDLVITDLSMPKMKGDLLARKIKEKSPGTPIIMLTGFGDIIKDISQEPGIVDCVLPKPIGIEKLREAISTVLEVTVGLPT